MRPRAARDPWRLLWRAGTSAGLLAALLLVLAAALAIVSWLPQTPGDGAVVYAEWRSQVQRELDSLQAKTPDALTDVEEALGNMLGFMEPLGKIL